MTEERLDRQAAAIRQLRKEVAALTVRVEGLTEALTEARASASPRVPGVGVFVPRAECVVCGRSKEPGRTALTCKECGAKRNQYIKDGKRGLILADRCVNCDEAKTKSTSLLCSPCSKAFKQWKAAQ